MRVWAIIEQTWRESWARKASLVLALVVLGLLALYAFGVHVRPLPDGGVSLQLFGVTLEELGPLSATLVSHYSAILALGLLVPWGLLLALFLTVGLFVEVLRPETLYLLLAKPLARWELLVARFAGALLLVGVTSLGFSLGAGALIGLKTGVWPVGLLAGTGLFLFEYALLAAPALLVAVLTRSTALALMTSILLYVLVSAVHFVKLRLYAFLSELWRAIVDGLYAVLPKFQDLETLSVFQVDPELARGSGAILLSSTMQVLVTSGVSLLVLLGLALWIFQRQDL